MCPGMVWDSFGPSFSPNGSSRVHLGTIFSFLFFWKPLSGSHLGPAPCGTGPRDQAQASTPALAANDSKICDLFSSTRLHKLMVHADLLQ